MSTDVLTESAPLTYHMDLSQVRQQLERANRYPQNISYTERIVCSLVGAGLAGFGLTRRSIPGALLAAAGAAFIERGATGHCSVYKKLGFNSSQK